MASSSPTRSIPAKYSAHSESANLFKFLTGTFFQMPKPIQIIGWLSFLLLFVYLVLYPMLGITYYEGKVVTISFDEQHKPHLAYASVISTLEEPKPSGCIIATHCRLPFSSRFS